METVPTLDKAPCAVPDWDSGELGWKGFQRELKPLGGTALVSIGATSAISFAFADSLDLTAALEHSITLLTVLVAIGILPLIRINLWRSTTDDHPDDTSDESASEDETAQTSEHRSITDEDLVVGLVAAQAGIAILFVLVHLALPEGDVRSMSGAVAIVLTLASIATVVKCTSILRYIRESSDAQETHSNLPLGSQRVAWLIDVLAFFLTGVLVLLILGVLALCGVTLGWAQQVPGWWSLTMGAFFVIQLGRLQLWQSTIGHRVARVKIVGYDGHALPFWRMGVRTLLPLLPLYLTFLLDFCREVDCCFVDDWHEDVNGWFGEDLVVYLFGVLSVWIILGIFSLLVMRQFHARGQGLLDILIRSVMVSSAAASDG